MSNMIYLIFFVTHQNEQKINNDETTIELKMLCSSIKISKYPNIYRTEGDGRVRLSLKNGCLKVKVYSSELLNPSVETMN